MRGSILDFITLPSIFPMLNVFKASITIIIKNISIWETLYAFSLKHKLFIPKSIRRGWWIDAIHSFPPASYLDLARY